MTTTSKTHDAKQSSIETVLRDAPANIKLVYESEDRRFCLFEDAEGHLTAVRASKLG